MDDKVFYTQYEAYREAVEVYLNRLLQSENPWHKLHESMRYSLLSGGKRLRPVLTLECARLGALADWRDALPFACALELVHTYSLIHDDLPCMDDDALRRGKPTNHVVFGETMATLSGDALQPEAYLLIARASRFDAETRLRAVEILASASGADGMVAGQVLDLSDYARDEDTLRELHLRKTGMMIMAAGRLGCAAAKADAGLCGAVDGYTRALGLAFQIRDDLLDVIGDEATFGKPIGSDREEGKTTFVDLLGAEGCEAEVRRLTDEAAAALEDVADSGFLIRLVRSLAQRSR